MGKRGQAAMEYMGIIVIVLIILVPVLILYIKYSGETKDVVVSSKVDSITNEISKASNQVFVYGAGTQSTVSISFPENINYIEFTNKDVTFHLINAKNQPYVIAKVIDTNFRPGIFYDLPQGKTQLKFTTCDDNTVEVCLVNTNLCTERCSVAQSLVLNYNFNADAGNTVKDSSSYKNDGTLNGQPLVTSGCVNGNCYNFDRNNDYIRAPNLLSSNQPFTAMAWIKATETTSSWKSVFGEGCSGFDLTINYATIKFGRNCGGANGRFYDGPTISANVWYHLAIVYDGTNVDLYKDGTRITGGTIILDHTGQNFCVGSYNCNSELFNGLIDEVRIYNRALSQQEIQSYYNANKP